MMFFGMDYNKILNMRGERSKIKYKVLFCLLIVYSCF